MAPFTDQYTVKLHDADAAGVVFFANVFRIAHDAYERFLAQAGYRFPERLAAGDFLLPIAHAEADYLHPLRVGDAVEIAASVTEVGESSFAVRFRLTAEDGSLRAKVKTVHVAVDGRTFKTIPLPEDFRKRLTAAAEPG